MLHKLLVLSNILLNLPKNQIGMNLKKQIPNVFTLLNLLAGTIAAIYAATGALTTAVYFVFLGIFFDFFDGFLARMLNVEDELGKQLDSLADIVTSGVVPGIVLFKLMSSNGAMFQLGSNNITWTQDSLEILPFFGLLFTLAAGLRLAKFNIDESQTNSFIGLPTPAAALVVMALPLIEIDGQFEFVLDLIENQVFLLAITLVLAILMNVRIPLFSLKFKDYSLQNNKIKFGFLVLSVVLIFVFKYLALPLIIFLYVLISAIANGRKIKI